MSLLLALPGVLIAILLTCIERSYELQDIPKNERMVSLDTLFTTIISCTFGTVAFIFLMLSIKIMTVDDLVTMVIVTIIVLHGLTKFDALGWLVRRLWK